jgi:general secretion pathway protein N
MMPSRLFSGIRLAILIGAAATCALSNATKAEPFSIQQTGNDHQSHQQDVGSTSLDPLSRQAAPPPSNIPTDQKSSDALDGPGNPLWSVPLNSLTATLQQPIFSRTRRPRPVVQAAAIQPALPPVVEQSRRPLLTLVGTIAGDGGLAIFVEETTKGIVRLKTGEGHLGWTLRRVENRQVILQKNHETTVFTLPAPNSHK